MDISPQVEVKKELVEAVSKVNSLLKKASQLGVSSPIKIDYNETCDALEIKIDFYIKI
jgi:hypothetical protein